MIIEWLFCQVLCLTYIVSLFGFLKIFIYFFIFGCIGSSLLRAGFLYLW